MKTIIRSLILVLLITSSYLNKVNAQWSTAGNVNASGFILGTTSGNFPLNIKNGANYPINFYTNGTQKITIDPNGKLGIGVATPNYLLDVNGEINMSNSNGIRMGGQYVLQTEGDPYNIFIGMIAGLYNTSGTQNTFCGYGAGLNNTTGSNNTNTGLGSGFSNTTGSDITCLGFYSGAFNTASENTFVGSNAAYSNTTGTGNTALGFKALYANTTGSNTTCIGWKAGTVNTASENIFIGSSCGLANTTATGNTAVGYLSLSSNTVGYNNTCLGWKAGAANTTIENVFIGYNSGALNTTGGVNCFVGSRSGESNTTGYNNTFIGYNAGGDNTDGYGNTALGRSSLALNTTGLFSTAIGAYALNVSTTGYENTAVGYSSLVANTTGIRNVAVGKSTLPNNTTGSQNVAIGTGALELSVSADFNTSVGYESMQSTTTGGSNVGIGYRALQYNTTGDLNTAIGDHAGYSGATHSRCTFLGSYSTLSTIRTNVTLLGYGIVNGQCTADNQVCLGNTAIVSPGLRSQQTGITAYSDARFKTNVKENVAGLDFILKLKPVTYNVKPTELHKIWGTPDSIVSKIDHSAAEKEIRIGFIAQDVEKAARESGFNFPGIDVPRNDNEVYTLRYVDFIMPMVKAMQEQQAKIEALEKKVSECCSSSHIINDEQGRLPEEQNNATIIELQYAGSSILYQNRPNPFGNETSINYYLPETAFNAKMVFYDNMGMLIKEVVLSQRGNSSVIVKSSEMSTGVYSYSLVVDGKVVATKMMVKDK